MDELTLPKLTQSARYSFARGTDEFGDLFVRQMRGPAIRSMGMLGIGMPFQEQTSELRGSAGSERDQAQLIACRLIIHRQLFNDRLQSLWVGDYQSNEVLTAHKTNVARSYCLSRVNVRPSR